MEQQQNNDRFTGQVKFFNRGRGFGFVTRLSDGKDFFVHYQDIQPKKECWNVLFQGEYIEFSIRNGPQGEQAGQVTGIQGGTLLCENHFNPGGNNQSSGGKGKGPRGKGRRNQDEAQMDTSD